jgi:hypothetical protein
MIKKWNNFGLETESINENVQQSKTYLVKKAQQDKKEQTGKDTPLDEREIRMAENNPNFLKIKDMVRDNPNWTYLFVKFFFEDEISMEDLQQLYTRLREFRQNLNELPMAPERYATIVPDDKDRRSGYERLTDGLTQIGLNRIAKKFVDKLPGEFLVNNKQAKDYGQTVPSMKDEYRRSPNTIKQKVAGISQALSELGEDKFNFFVSKIKRYRSLNEVINAANNFIKASNIDGQQKFIEALIDANKKFGEVNGAEVVFDENNILIIEVRSFQANRALNANTSHCIKDSQGHWDSYVGDNNYNKQYYIYNFNLSPSDNYSIIGITIEPNQKIRACHIKNDNSLGTGSTFPNLLKDWQKKYNINDDLWSYFKPMTNEEITIKKKRIEANKKIVNQGLSVDQVRSLVEDGGDPSAGGGKPLINAVVEKNKEKMKYLLEAGASPNIGEPIRQSKDLETIKILIEAGAEMHKDLLNNDLVKDYDAMKYLLDAGLDPNFDSGLPLRLASREMARPEVAKLLVEYGAKPEERRCMALRTAAQWGHLDLVRYYFEQLERRNFDYTNIIQHDGSVGNVVLDIIGWVKDSTFIKDENVRNQMIALLRKKSKTKA